ncbi:MAG: zf-TFIIB domain-containing protein [Gemmatimonadales bacterium]|nr:zf-TFIIB domain-containing protein [Gemmatimonadales bacterium]
MKCPVCRTVMFVVEYEGVELDVCQDCRGTWFDRGELDLVLGDQATLELTPALTAEDDRGCPICSESMGKMNIGPGGRVMIDACPEQCGMWFDRGEVSDLIGDLETGGWELPDSVREFLSRMFPASSD